MTKRGSLFVVDDNPNILKAVRMLMEDDFKRIITLSSPASLPSLLKEERPDVMLLDMNFSAGINSGAEGLHWLGEVKRLSPQTEVVLFTAYADIDLAVQGIKNGAADFIVKPWENDRMVATLTSARDNGETSAQGSHPSPITSKSSSPTPNSSSMYWGESDAMNSLRRIVEKVATTDANILITGENGTGKEVLAKELHRLSRRNARVMMSIDMGAVTETLFESELFGHVKGAFTDAKTDRQGKFELAEGGTLFLDEIGNLSYGLQAKLLTALQSRTIVRVGGAERIPIDVRLICATNRDLPQMVIRGEFREDLLYRINTIRLHLPPLRERRTDIVPLARLFLDRYASMYNKPPMTFSPEAAAKLEALPWHGNVRELQHSVEKAVILSDGTVIAPDDIEGDTAATPRPTDGAQTLDEMERSMIERTMASCQGNLSMVASRLGISRQTLYNKIKRYGL